MTRSRLASAWLPVVLWAALIFALSSIPSLGTGLGTWDLVLRKLAHATEYAVLGYLLGRATGRELPAALAGVAYAASDEIHQHFVPGRHGAPYDVAIDAAGVLIGVYVSRSWTASALGRPSRPSQSPDVAGRNFPGERASPLPGNSTSQPRKDVLRSRRVALLGCTVRRATRLPPLPATPQEREKAE